MKKRKSKNILFILLFLFIGIGFAYISSNLSILGNNMFGKGNWSIYFTNIHDIKGNEFVIQGPSTSGKNTTDLNFEVEFGAPGDYYEFSVDVVNEGSTDAMINLINKTSLTEAQMEYCKYYITYGNGVLLDEKQLLKKDKTLTYTVHVEYNYEMSEEVYEMEKSSISFQIGIEYTIADEEGVDVPVSFEDDSWETIVKAVKSGEHPYKVGDTKCVHLNGYSTTNDNGCNGDFKVRISNTSTPDECNEDDFSQSACGFVLEFEDIITTHIMNPSGEYKGTQYDYGWNKDGWPSSSMREFVNNDIYNSLPDILKDNIIDTYTISGYGKNDNNGTGPEGNWESIDKLYLLAPHEVWIDGSSNLVSTNDKGYNYTRQLDYYLNLGVTTNNYSFVIKYRNGSASWWWLRGAHSSNTYSFYSVHYSGDWYNNNASYANGVSPAFRLG